MEIPKRNGEMFMVTDELLREFAATYPGLNVRLELQKARAWLLANPRRRKSDVYRFLVNWLNKAKPEPQRAVPRSTIEDEETSKRKWAQQQNAKGLPVPDSYRRYL